MTPAFFFIVRLYSALCTLVNWIFGPVPKDHAINYNVLSDDYDVDDLAHMDRVPEDSIYIEEWIKTNRKRCVLFYEGEAITRETFDPFEDEPYVYEGEAITRETFDPFEDEPYVPWIWIGDKKTEVDLTNAMQKYMAVGNVIRLDLILHMIQVHYDTEIMYVDARTLEEVKFPASGVRIVAANGNKNTLAA